LAKRICIEVDEQRPKGGNALIVSKEGGMGPIACGRRKGLAEMRRFYAGEQFAQRGFDEADVIVR